MKSRGFLQLFASMSVCLVSVSMVTDCKAKGLRYLRLVESMCYNQRALFFALFLSFLQPVISQGACPPGTAATQVATLQCGRFSIEKCPSTPLEGPLSSGETSGTISDLSGNYANNAYCWWLLSTTSPGATIHISFPHFSTKKKRLFSSV